MGVVGRVGGMLLGCFPGWSIDCALPSRVGLEISKKSPPPTFMRFALVFFCRFDLTLGNVQYKSLEPFRRHYVTDSCSQAHHGLKVHQCPSIYPLMYKASFFLIRMQDQIVRDRRNASLGMGRDSYTKTF